MVGAYAAMAETTSSAKFAPNSGMTRYNAATALIMCSSPRIIVRERSGDAATLVCSTLWTWTSAHYWSGCGTMYEWIGIKLGTWGWFCRCRDRGILPLLPAQILQCFAVRYPVGICLVFIHGWHLINKVTIDYRITPNQSLQIMSYLGIVIDTNHNNIC